MANNQSFLTLQQDLSDRCNVDQTVAANATRLKRCLNQIVQDICGRWPWRWLEARTIIQTVVDETAGTVSVTKGATAVTGVGTAFVAADASNSYIQFAGNNDWYGISAFTSATSITLDTAFGQTTVSAGTYTVRRVFYSLPSAVDRVIDVRGFNLPMKLVQIGETTLDAYDPNFSKKGQPVAYALIKPDPTVAVSVQPQWQLAFEPIADAVYNLEVRYMQTPVDMSANTDIIIIPYKYNLILLDGATSLYYLHQNDPSYTTMLAQYEAGIRRMTESANEDDDTFYVLQPNEVPSTQGFIPLPSQYGPSS